MLMDKQVLNERIKVYSHRDLISRFWRDDALTTDLRVLLTQPDLETSTVVKCLLKHLQPELQRAIASNDCDDFWFSDRGQLFAGLMKTILPMSDKVTAYRAFYFRAAIAEHLTHQPASFDFSENLLDQIRTLQPITIPDMEVSVLPAIDSFIKAEAQSQKGLVC